MLCVGGGGLHWCLGFGVFLEPVVDGIVVLATSSMFIRTCLQLAGKQESSCLSRLEVGIREGACLLLENVHWSCHTKQ